MFNCKHCNKNCKNHNSWRNHERLCSKNLNKQISSLEKFNKSNRPRWNKGLTKETDARVANMAKNVSKATKGKPSNHPWTEEQRKAKSEWKKKYHKLHPEKHPNRKLANNKKYMSYPEKIAYDFLTLNNIKFQHNKKIGKYFPDFLIDNFIIEIDGSYWHNKEKDDNRDKELKEMGYIVYRINAKSHIETELQNILLDKHLRQDIIQP